MRRAIALGLVALALGAWLLARPGAEEWVVEVSADRVTLNFEDPCTPRPEPDLVTDGFYTGGGGFWGLLVTRNEADALTVAGCYEAHGIHTEVRAQTSADAEQIDEMRS